MLRDEIFAVLSEETRDLWQVEDREFLRQLAADVARQKLLGGPESERNLRHLAATMEGEIIRKKLQIAQGAFEIFSRVLSGLLRAWAIPELRP